MEVISCYEAGYDGFWLHRVLEAHGVRNYVIDPASVQVDRRARRVKTDNIDLARLLRSLMAYLRGEPIHGELLKLGFAVAQSTVAKYMVRRSYPSGQSWGTFLRNHAPHIAAMDRSVVPTIGFDLTVWSLSS